MDDVELRKGGRQRIKRINLAPWQSGHINTKARALLHTMELPELNPLSLLLVIQGNDRAPPCTRSGNVKGSDFECHGLMDVSTVLDQLVRYITRRYCWQLPSRAVHVPLASL